MPMAIWQKLLSVQFALRVCSDTTNPAHQCIFNYNNDRFYLSKPNAIRPLALRIKEDLQTICPDIKAITPNQLFNIPYWLLRPPELDISLIHFGKKTANPNYTLRNEFYNLMDKYLDHKILNQLRMNFVKKSGKNNGALNKKINYTVFSPPLAIMDGLPITTGLVQCLYCLELFGSVASLAQHKQLMHKWVDEEEPVEGEEEIIRMDLKTEIKEENDCSAYIDYSAILKECEYAGDESWTPKIELNSETELKRETDASASLHEFSTNEDEFSILHHKIKAQIIHEDNYSKLSSIIA
ncbi:hypothetical protein CAPTEDRAFT_206615, partial [Capitella teleta]